MDKFTSATVTPAYGRDYRSKAAAIADWKAGKDFMAASVDGRPGGGYNICGRDAANGATITIRYDKLRKVVIHKHTE